MKQPATSEDLNIEPSLAQSEPSRMPAIGCHVQQAAASPRPLSLPVMFVLLVEVDVGGDLVQ
jgi:hypothetical protein